ncbi:Cytochrome P450 4C1 [Amphibalanus amphitrite]|uniref:Cytochrome P450 4C1 n=1 Tax=Amphibalanus amphitrite TaxID=1232801 RepID=A0A6A4V490_AMPAM|nr:Cytochrome P450 4C1 [Amphibalanus amphitrite]
MRVGKDLLDMLMHYVRQYRGFFHLQLGVDYVVINSPEAAEGAPRVRVRVEAYYSADVDALPDTGADISVGGIQFLDDMNEFPENLLPPNEHPKAADGATVKSIGVLPHSAADALSRNPIEHPNEDDECGEDATTSCIQSIVISELKAHDVDISLKEVREAAAADHEFQLLAEVIRNGFPDSTKWHKRRKMLTPAFHFTILDQFMDVFNEQSQVLVAKLKDTGGQRVNVFPFITKATLDIICEATMGVQIKAQDGARTDYVQAVYDMGEVVFFRFMRPWLRNDLVFRLSSLYKVQKDSLKLLHGFTDSVIRTRREELSKATSCDGGAVTDEAGEFLHSKKKRRAFLDLLLHSTIDGRPLSDADIREEVDTFMFEGHDTTSAGTNWALYNLGRNPDVQQKVYDELVEVLGDQQRPLTRDDLPKLRYLEMVIKETLRLFPPVPMIGRRLNSDTVIDGYPIPGSCNVGLLVYAIHRDPVHWPDPERFDPERFSPENSKGRHPYSYVPFSAGPRNCIGQKFALMEEKVLLASVVRTFHVTSHDSLDTIKLRPDVILRLEGGLFLSFTPRNQ